MTEKALEIHPTRREALWRVGQTPPAQRLQTPWGELWRGREQGAGQEVWIEAREAFDLTMIYGAVSYFEALSPGRHRFILTFLDSTDVG